MLNRNEETYSRSLKIIDNGPEIYMTVVNAYVFRESFPAVEEPQE